MVARRVIIRTKNISGSAVTGERAKEGSLLFFVVDREVNKVISSDIMYQIPLRLSDEEAQGLKDKSLDTGISISRLVRHSIRNFLSGHLTCGISIGSGVIVSGSVLVIQIK